MAASKTPVKEANPKAARPAARPAKDSKGGASSSRSAKQGEKKTSN